MQEKGLLGALHLNYRCNILPDVQKSRSSLSILNKVPWARPNRTPGPRSVAPHWTQWLQVQPVQESLSVRCWSICSPPPNKKQRLGSTTTSSKRQINEVWLTHTLVGYLERKACASSVPKLLSYMFEMPRASCVLAIHCCGARPGTASRAVGGGVY